METSIYGIEQTKKSTGGSEYFGFTLKGDEAYYNQLLDDMELIRKKLGVSGKKMILLGAISIAAKSLKTTK